MTNPTLERAARAACRAAGHDPDGPTMDIYVPGDPDAGSPWASYRNIARAVLMAVREPDEAMLDAGCNVGPDTNNGEFSYDDARTVYVAMIQAILNDGEGE